LNNNHPQFSRIERPPSNFQYSLSGSIYWPSPVELEAPIFPPRLELKVPELLEIEDNF